MATPRISTAGKFEKTTITLHVKPNRHAEPVPVTVDAFVHKGLAVHRTQGSLNPDYVEWSVSHRASGKRFGQFRGVNDAKQFLLRMADVVDWRASEETILSHSTKIMAAMVDAFDGLSRVH